LGGSDIIDEISIKVGRIIHMTLVN